jgi:hypothetical protein
MRSVFNHVFFPVVIFFYACACQPVQPALTDSPISVTPNAEGSVSLDPNGLLLLVDDEGDPISTHIIEDTSLVTVHTFDLFPIVLAAPTKTEADGQWRVPVWVPAGNSTAHGGYVVTLVLGYDETLVEYELLPGRVFEWKSGHTAPIGEIVEEIIAGEQITVHVIGEHVFTNEDMEAIAALGFDYPQLVDGHEEQNMAILKALVQGRQPPAGEIRGVGLIYRGTE